MRLAEFLPGVKAKLWHYPDLPKDIFIFIALSLIGVGGFFVERIMSMEVSRKAELRIIQTSTMGNENGVGNTTIDKTQNASTTENIRGMYVASKTGTVYYAPWCGGVKQIHDENKVWFGSKAEAEAKGYRPAANCKGI